MSEPISVEQGREVAEEQGQILQKVEKVWNKVRGLGLRGLGKG